MTLDQPTIESLAERLESTLSEFFYQETKRRPMIFVILNAAPVPEKG